MVTYQNKSSLGASIRLCLNWHIKHKQKCRNKLYELTNHLGNLLLTITDKKIPVTASPNDAIINYFTADVVTANDYYPGGMLMPGRKYQASATSNYRYSINGQEKSDELNENLTTALYWEYDSRIGRRWNVDPVLKVGESPYLCFSGNPIFYADPLGNTTCSPTDWIKKKNANGTTSYKWDDKAKNQGTTPLGYKYVGATGRYPNNDYSNVDLYANGGWIRSSGVNAESGSKGSTPPIQEAPSAASSAPLNIKPGPQATVGPVGYTFNNDFERGMIKDNIATQASVMTVGGVTSTIATKLFLNSAVQLSVSGKNADFADVGINSFSPLNYANLYGTAAVDWKPLSGDLIPQVVFINKSWQKAALDLGLNKIFYGVGKFNEAVAPNLSSTQKLVVGTVNSVNKAVVKKVFSEGMYQASPSNNVSESTKAPPLYNPGLKQ